MSTPYQYKESADTNNDRDVWKMVDKNGGNPLNEYMNAPILDVDADGDYRAEWKMIPTRRWCAVCGWGGKDLVQSCRICGRWLHDGLCDQFAESSRGERFCTHCVRVGANGTGHPNEEPPTRACAQFLRSPTDSVSMYVGPPLRIMRHFVRVHAPRADTDVVGGNLIVACEDADKREELAAMESKESKALESTAYLLGYFRDVTTTRTTSIDAVDGLAQFWPHDRPSLDRTPTDFQWFRFRTHAPEAVRYDLMYLARFVTMTYRLATQLDAKFYSGTSCAYEVDNHPWTGVYRIRYTQSHRCVACARLGCPLRL